MQKPKYVDLTNAQSLGSTNVRFTIGYREDAVDQFGGSVADGTGQVGYDTFFVSGLADHTFSDKLSLAVSARFDSLSSYRTADEVPDLDPFTNDDFDTFSEISINAGLTYQASDVDTLKLMYARGFQAPSLFQKGGQTISFTALPGLVGGGGNPFVETVVSTQYELQYMRSLDSLNGSLSASVFYREDDGAISAGSVTIFPLDENNAYFGADNIAAPETVGVELSVKGKTDSNFIWGMNYIYADTTDNPFDTTGLVRVNEVSPIIVIGLADRSSKHIVTANFGYQSDKFSFDALIQHKSGYSSTNNVFSIPGFVDPYVDVDSVWIGNLAAHYQLTENVKLSVVGEGLFDKLQQQGPNLSLSAQRRVRASLSVSF
jgi:iron complex outermembrane receptor protein